MASTDFSMVSTDVCDREGLEVNAEAVREQLETLVQDRVFRTSKRSIQFLRFVVEKTLEGDTDQIKERTIGVEVFGRDPSYDTNVDHVVRTAAIELRKRLAIYYGEEEHRAELRMNLVPGSYIPRFVPPANPVHAAPLEPEATTALAPAAYIPAEEIFVESGEIPTRRRAHWLPYYAVPLVALLIAGVAAGYAWWKPVNAQDLFWKPVVDTPGAVLLAIGDVPNGPPSSPAANGGNIPIIHKTSAPSVPFADAVTLARVSGILQAHGKAVTIRPESATSFSDLREGPVVLIGAFNNEWSLRMTSQLRYTLALDEQQHLIYIRDTANPGGRAWSWQTDKSTEHHGEVSGPPLQDYALISRIWNSQTGHVVIVVGGLYTYGTQAAGEFLADPQLFQAVAKAIPLDNPHTNLQIVLGTTITDGTPGPPRVLAVHAE